MSNDIEDDITFQVMMFFVRLIIAVLCLIFLAPIFRDISVQFCEFIGCSEELIDKWLIYFWILTIVKYVEMIFNLFKTNYDLFKKLGKIEDLLHKIVYPKSFKEMNRDEIKEHLKEILHPKD